MTFRTKRRPSAAVRRKLSSYSPGRERAVAGIEEAYHLLEPIVGSGFAPALFAVALIAAGQYEEPDETPVGLRKSDESEEQPTDGEESSADEE